MDKTSRGWKHRLENINSELMIADCAHCGLGVKIVFAERYRCWMGRQKGGVYGNYSLKYEDKVRLFGDQRLCPICQKNLSYSEASLDHDHRTGELRGFICNGCNLGLGKLGDNEEGLLRALEYIKNPPLQRNTGEVKNNGNI